MEVFDAHLNRTQLNECLKQLLVCYDSVDGDAEELSPAREQMEALYALLHLGNVDALYRLLSLRPPQLVLGFLVIYVRSHLIIFIFCVVTAKRFRALQFFLIHKTCTGVPSKLCL